MHSTTVISGLTWYQCIVEDQQRVFGSAVGTDRDLWCCPLLLGLRQEQRLVMGNRTACCFLLGTSSLQLKAEEVWFLCTSCAL